MKKLLITIILLTALLQAKDNILTHVVLCWMDTTVTEAEIDTIIKKTKKLKEIPGIVDLMVGRPVESERPIVDDSFSLGITMTFRSKEKMNRYLKDDRHTSFTAKWIKPRLSKLLVYDIAADQK